MKEEYYYLGKITKLFGLKGELIFFLDVDDINEYQGLDAVFMDLNGEKVPFMIDKFTLKTHNSAIAKLYDIKNADDALKFINKSLFLPIKTLPKLKGNKFYFHEVIGFVAIDKIEGEIGIITDVNDQTAQALLIIQDGNKEILFPIADDLIEKIDRKAKKVFLNSPEGLLDIYR
jgi:16S rRNA processing protein RimM